MTPKKKFEILTAYFQKNMPVAETELIFNDPFQLLVAVILSAQCTDKRVNIITPPLFKRFPDAMSMSLSSKEEIFEFIKSCSYPNNKASHLFNLSKELVDRFNGKVPQSVDELQTLPGVGRKTANVIASVLFNAPVIAVDTHVFRVAARIGLSKNAKNPLDTELQLNKIVPGELRSVAHHWLILHGRYVCKARNPLCAKCGISEVCDYFAKSLPNN